MIITKPKLSLEGQIEHLKKKGVLFNIMNEESAKEYLTQHNNYFKLTAYRKNYDKHPDGENKGKYINLEFAYLVDLAVIDMRLRYRIVHMALDIEHHTKLQLLRMMDKFNEDGYQIVQDYMDSLSEVQRKNCDSEINRNKGNIYCGDIVDKYDGAYPIWAFIEIIPFGRLVVFYGFCADRFADKDLAVIDMRLRYRIVHMALDIEHHTKLQLLRMMDKFNEDGYQIVQDYMDSLSEVQRKNCDSEINRNKGNIYCGDIVDKYDGAYPIWAFIEIIPFGRLVVFYGFCADRFADKEMKNNFYRLLTCKEIRNASAHSNCILNDLKARTAAHKTNTAVTNELMMINDMNSNFRRNRMSNARIQQLVTLFYMHRTMVESDGIKKSESEEIQKVMKRIDRNYDYYSTNPMIKGTFDFLKMVVDNWFKTV